MQQGSPKLTLLHLSLALLILFASTIARAQTVPLTKIESNKQFGGAFENDESDVTLFRGAANNSWFPVYFNAEPQPGAEDVPFEIREINLRPERDVTLHVEIYNPEGSIPLVITPGGNGDTEGFGGFARNVAAAEPDFRVIIYDRRNIGLSEVTFGTQPQMMEEGEDLHVLVRRLGLAPAAFYGMSSGARSNMVLASRYPEDIAAIIIAPLTGGPYAAARLSEDYFFKYLPDKTMKTREHLDNLPLKSMQDVAGTEYWSAYLERNSPERRARFFNADVSEFLAAMRISGEHLQATRFQTALGMPDEELAAIRVPAALLLHHDQYSDNLHPITNSRAATTLLKNSTFAFGREFPQILEALVPFVKAHTPSLN